VSRLGALLPDLKSHTLYECFYAVAFSALWGSGLVAVTVWLHWTHDDDVAQAKLVAVKTHISWCTRWKRRPVGEPVTGSWARSNTKSKQIKSGKTGSSALPKLAAAVAAAAADGLTGGDGGLTDAHLEAIAQLTQIRKLTVKVRA
jgi:hypothetical protein